MRSLRVVATSEFTRFKSPHVPTWCPLESRLQRLYKMYVYIYLCVYSKSRKREMSRSSYRVCYFELIRGVGSVTGGKIISVGCRDRSSNILSAGVKFWMGSGRGGTGCRADWDNRIEQYVAVDVFYLRNDALIEATRRCPFNRPIRTISAFKRSENIEPGPAGQHFVKLMVSGKVSFSRLRKAVVVILD